MKNSKHRIALVLGGALLGSIVTVLLTRSLSKDPAAARDFPIAPANRRIAAQESNPLEKLRSELPPFVYTFGQTGLLRQPEARFGFAERLTWYFEIQLANLTRERVGPVEVAISVTDMNFDLFVLPSSSLVKSDGQRFRPEEVLAAKRSTTGATVSVHVDEMASGISHAVQFVITSNTNPGIDFGEISIGCPRGRFERISAAQWDDIGWHADLEPR